MRCMRCSHEGRPDHDIVACWCQGLICKGCLDAHLATCPHKPSLDHYRRRREKSPRKQWRQKRRHS